MPDDAPRVLLSYSHDSDEHRDRVLALADRLRAEGIEAHLDQYETAPTTNFVPVVFSPRDAAHIPIVLRPFTWYDVSTDDGYERLYRRLTNQPEVVKPPVGERRTLPPRPARSRTARIFMVPYARNPYFTGREDVRHCVIIELLPRHRA